MSTNVITIAEQLQTVARAMAAQADGKLDAASLNALAAATKANAALLQATVNALKTVPPNQRKELGLDFGAIDATPAAPKLVA
jgi:hypothetical protein